MGLRSSDRETPTATYEELQAFRAKAIEMAFALTRNCGADRLGMAATFERISSAPLTYRIIARKSVRTRSACCMRRPVKRIGCHSSMTLALPLYPELMAELDAIKRERIGGLMLRRDWGDRRPWPTPSPDNADLTHMSRKVKGIISAAGLRDELTFTSFRHGGFTESADADLSTPRSERRVGIESAKVLPRYAKRTMKQVAAGTKKRRSTENEGWIFVRMSNSPVVRMAGPK